jgi:hypothetical protein
MFVVYASRVVRKCQAAAIPWKIPTMTARQRNPGMTTRPNRRIRRQRYKNMMLFLIEPLPPLVHAPEILEWYGRR